MARAPSLAGVILAAGESSRMGRDKALLPWRGETFLTAAIDSLRMSTELIVVVAGSNADVLRPVVDAAGVFLVVNPAPERGQFSSLQVGLQEVLNRGRDAAMITLVDRPPLRRQTVAELRAAFDIAITQGKWAVVPEHDGKHGHPIVVAREMITAFLTAPVETTARDVEHAHESRIQYVPVDDPLVIANIDTPADYQQITARAT
jgi:molybdenum cofactor cytidylyltransferase